MNYRILLVMVIAGAPCAFAQRTDNATASKETTESAIVLSPFTVTSGSDNGYQATNAITATKLRTPIYELPLSVSVATEALIKDIGAPDIQAALRYVTNVERNFNPESHEQYSIRGASLGPTGVYVNSRSVKAPVADTYNISRIEVAKGPSSTIMGASSAVGVINYLLKKPILNQQFEEVNFRVGSYDNYRGTFDVNIPYDFRGRKSGMRLMGVYEDSMSFIPFVSRKTKGLTLTNVTQLTDSLTLDVYLEQLNMDRVNWTVFPEAGLLHVGAKPPYGSGGGWSANIRDINGNTIPLTQPVLIGGVPVRTGMFVSGIYDLVQLASIGGPDNSQLFESLNGDFSLNWTPSRRFNVEAFYSAGRQSKFDLRKEPTNILRYSGVRVTNGVAVYDPAGGSFFQNSFVTYQPQLPSWRHYARISGFYELVLPFMKQDVRFGAETFGEESGKQQVSRITAPGTKTSITQFVYLNDISAATTGIQRWFDAGGVKTPISQNLQPKQTYKAFFLSAQGSYLNNRVRTVLGVRRDIARQRSWASYNVPIGGSFDNDPAVPTSDLTYKATSALFSISMEPVRGISLYYNQAESFGLVQAGAPVLNYDGLATDDPAQALASGRFNPNNAGTTPPPPETGSSNEFGVKVSMLGGKLSATIARYTNERENVRSNWPNTFIQGLLGSSDPRVGNGFTAVGVNQKASGWEAEIQASPTENITFAVGYSEPKVTFTANPVNPLSIGQPNSANFKYTFNLVGRYTFTQGKVSGLYLGTSVQTRGPFLLTTNQGGFSNPGYTVANPFIGYRWKSNGRWETDVRFDASNVFDTKYALSQTIGDPRSIYLSVSLKFR